MDKLKSLRGLKLERYRNLNKEQKTRLKLLAGAILVAVLLVISLVLTNLILKNPNIYGGVQVDGLDVGGMSPQELDSFLNDKYKTLLEDINITFFTNDFEKSVSLPDLGVAVNVDSMQTKAQSIGREGFFLSRVFQISSLKKNPISVPLELKIDENRLNTVIEDLNNYFRTEVTVPKVIISGDTATLCTGVSGWEVDKEQLKTKIIETVYNRKHAYVHIPLKEILPPAIDVDTVYNSIVQEPANAAIIKDEKGSAKVKPQTNGRTIDKNQLAEIVKRAEEKEYKTYEEIKLPVTVTEPEIKTRDLDALLFRDVLASAKTAFTTDNDNNRNRGVNIRIAAQAINGTVLFPGEEFSFNNIVGPRTSDKGYLVAHVFSEGKVSDGYGGGVCQVSTTLYDAALLANLNITERHNHSFAVGYVPLGLDASVSFGNYDLRFTNTTDYPVRINAEVSGDNTLAFSISGTNLYPNVKVKTVTKNISTTRTTTEYQDDPALPLGNEVVDSYGIDGAVVDTYIQIYSGKDLIKDYKIHTSTYQMLPKKVRRGVQKAANAP